jgi:hypothetical protein
VSGLVGLAFLASFLTGRSNLRTRGTDSGSPWTRVTFGRNDIVPLMFTGSNRKQSLWVSVPRLIGGGVLSIQHIPVGAQSDHGPGLLSSNPRSAAHHTLGLI